MRIGRHTINPIDAVLAVLVPVTAIGLYAEFFDYVPPRDAIRAALAGDVSFIRERVDENFDFLAVDERGRTLLHAAAESGNADMVEHILRSGGAVSLGAFDDFGFTPVHLALGIHTPYGQIVMPTIETFLTFGCNPNQVTRDGVSLLASAVKSRRETAALSLLDAGADTDVGIIAGRPLLTTVTASGMTELLRALLERGVSANPKSTGNASLAYAIANHDIDAVRLLLEYGADPNKDFETEWLSTDPMERGASYARWRQPDGTALWGPVLTHFARTPAHPMRMTPLDFALFRDWNFAKALIEHGARAELFPRILARALCR